MTAAESALQMAEPLAVLTVYLKAVRKAEKKDGLSVAETADSRAVR